MFYTKISAAEPEFLLSALTAKPKAARVTSSVNVILSIYSGSYSYNIASVEHVERKPTQSNEEITIYGF